MYLAQGYNTATRVRIEPPTSRSGVRPSTTRPRGKVPEITSHTMDETLKETVEDKTNVNNDIETDDEEIVESDKEIEIVKKEKVVTEVEEDTEVDKGATVLRRSKRDRKLPKRFDSYQMNQITSRPLDRRLHSLQILLGSGILNEMDSDMTDKVLEAVTKK